VIDSVPESADGIRAIGERYAVEYEREFGYRLDEEIGVIEFVNARVAAIGITDDADIEWRSEGSSTPEPRGSRRVYFDETADFTETPIYERASLGPGACFDGPAVIEQMDTTVLVPPGARASVDDVLNIVIDTNGSQALAAGPVAATTGA